MRIVIVDDEPLARQRLQLLLAGLEGYEVIGEAGDGATALTEIARLQPDLLLLDIRMPGIDGMQVAQQLRQQSIPPLVIFTTAYSEHAIDAFGVEAIDYLLKPIRVEKLQAALQRAEERLRQRLPVGGDAEIIPEIRTTYHGGEELIPVTEILYAQAESKYVTLYLTGRERLVEDSLRQLEQRLGRYLLRVHRNALVGRRQISGMLQYKGEHYVQLQGGQRGPQISRRHLSEVKQLLQQRTQNVSPG